MPPEDSRHNTPEMKQLLEYISRHNDNLLKTMTDQQKEIFEKFEDCWGEYASLSDEALFEYAFKLGARLILDVIDILKTQQHYLKKSKLLFFV